MVVSSHGDRIMRRKRKGTARDEYIRAIAFKILRGDACESYPDKEITSALKILGPEWSFEAWKQLHSTVAPEG